MIRKFILSRSDLNESIYYDSINSILWKATEEFPDTFIRVDGRYPVADHYKYAVDGELHSVFRQDRDNVDLFHLSILDRAHPVFTELLNVVESGCGDYKSCEANTSL